MLTMDFLQPILWNGCRGVLVQWAIVFSQFELLVDIDFLISENYQRRRNISSSARQYRR